MPFCEPEERDDMQEWQDHCQKDENDQEGKQAHEHDDPSGGHIRNPLPAAGFLAPVRVQIFAI